MDGLILANAGNTVSSVSPKCPPVYPRWRGEHVFPVCCLLSVCGLSRLARGTRRNGSDIHDDHRFIPAGAGNTLNIMMRTEWGAVYPRWRGEHQIIGCPSRRMTGLSPLARGTRDGRVSFYHCGRFIPAGAGNTRRQSVVLSLRAVYPRWRGEHQQRLHVEDATGGLSPLARGTRKLDQTNNRISRFIPAGAGNTT